MRKILSLMLAFTFILTAFVLPVSAAEVTPAQKIINGWKGDIQDVDFIEGWYAQTKGMSKDEVWEYLEADYDYVIPLKDVAFDDIAGLDSEEAVKTLGKLGIVTGREEGKFFPEASLTRAEMVTILLRVFGQDEYKGDFKFDDVLESHWAYKNVLTAYGMGIVNGTSATTFSPDLALTYEQAVKMLVAALGYDAKAVELGGWPTGYIAQAEAMNLLGATKPANTASEINRGTMAILINNSIKATELAIDYVDPYKEKIRLKNAPEALEFIALDTPMMNVDRTLTTYEDCNEWDTLAVLQSKFDNKVIGGVKFDYVGGSWEYRNMDAWQWVRDEKIRGCWGFILGHEKYGEVILDPLYEEGLNLAFTTMYGGVPEWDEFPSVNSKLDNIDEYAAAHPGLRFNLVQQVGTGRKNSMYGLYHGGTVRAFTNTPCPLSEDYWQRVCFEKMALAATHESIGVINLDWEMYTADQTSYAGPCFCDNCFNGFIEKRGYKGHEVTKVDITERKDAVFAAGLMNEYTWYWEQETVEICQKFVKALHDINPNLIVSYTPTFEIIAGISRGLGTPWMPSMCMEEGTYRGGLLDVDSRQQEIADKGMPLATCVGLWNNPIGPEDLDEKIAHASYNTDGFWIYDSQYFAKDPNYTFFEDDQERSPELYLESFGRGVDYLNKFLETGEKLPAEEYEILTYDIKKIAGEPTDADWEKAEWTSSFRKYDITQETGIAKGHDTKAKLLWDGKYLYVKVENYESYMDELAPPSVGPRDTWSWANQEVNEVFWKFYDDPKGIHIASNREACNIYDSCITSVGVQSAAYDFEDIKVTSKDYSNKWVMTFKVPLTIDGIRYAQSGEQIKVLVARMRSHPSDNTNYQYGSVIGTFITAMSLWATMTLE